METSKILVVEDDKSIREMLTFALETEGFSVDVSKNGTEALMKNNEFKPNLVLLDLMLPDINGFEVCKKIQQERDIPIIMVTAKNDIVDKVLGLEIGADDYITKPFHIKEVIARVNKSLKRIEKAVKAEREQALITIGKDIFLDEEGRIVVKKGKEINLRPKEYDLIYLLATNKGKVFSREELLNKIWSYDYYGELRTVDVHVRRLRAKIEDDENKYIETVFGVGYKMR
ncbi:response regulator transcription factor [Clostridium saccharoperbutylacetonicum]|jgi:DNA-binding response OmpR family regulator|uniref:Stage 0 sporulation protein A homolog n=1 Tax=Clostridium saccharoperbutylacetonicum N1-4(HMT) TaxID=931276 RepID=M1N1I6_9CLOT|nr:response regulator transcription factor [Clostridium saccharoperbutylacetonicum]AGF57342.1 Two component transcriptional regulator, winged helix family [Clostridium saccharoperbutylacetonicum N1-4(HMT)]NRT61895.1 DNA-binding response OmpR family regulator [Clostridium saccharoperbutylacetonicum]NSB25221.1 DNA-binding response OmpR family regulator [Clostridium saccharoperbutylacetonicum]NSB44593.1 DNA-binding response OmpR family regulator [Clostridium saccharoperbutylacetonicum]